MNKRFNIYNASFEEFIEMKNKIWQNIREIRGDEGKDLYFYGLPHLNNCTYERVDTLLARNSIDKDNFRQSWVCEIIAIHWNNEPYGLDYNKFKRQYKKRSEDPESIETLKKIYVQGHNHKYNRHFQKTQVALKEDRFLSFWEWVTAHNDTKGPWRHWWDAVTSENRYKIGEMVEFRSTTSSNHVYEIYQHPYNTRDRYLRCIKRSEMKDIKQKVFIILDYNKHSPKKTYSYKKSQGSHKLVTILPIGSTETYHVPEQFVKISRKKALKDARK